MATKGTAQMTVTRTEVHKEQSTAWTEQTMVTGVMINKELHIESTTLQKEHWAHQTRRKQEVQWHQSKHNNNKKINFDMQQHQHEQQHQITTQVQQEQQHD